jgi:type I restriction enzyme S subunit
MIADLKSYAEYKDSGLPWLRQVPGHWEIKRGKSYLTAIDERSKTGKEELLTVSSARGVVPRRTANVTMFKAESYAGHKLCWPDDLVVNSLWAWAGGLGVSEHHGIISTAYSVYRARRSAGINPRFLHQLVRSSAYQWELQVRSKGIWISRLQLTDTAFLDSPIPLPPPEEQAAIVRFLDWANDRLERGIRTKRKVIALLNEQKQAIIHRAVTRGLDPNVPLKSSGIRWLGNIPAHWDVVRVCRLFHQVVRYNAQGDEPKMSMSRRYGLVRSDQLTNRAAQAATSIKFSVCMPGDLVMNKYQAHNGLFGAATERGLITSNYSVFEPAGSVFTDFFSALFGSPLYRAEFRMRCQGVGDGMMPLYSSAFLKTPVIAPPAMEQQGIVAFIIDSTKDIERVISRLEREIALLREYRTRLVADVVTGKLDVREAATRLPDEELLPDLSAADDEPDDLPIEEEDDA